MNTPAVSTMFSAICHDHLRINFPTLAPERLVLISPTQRVYTSSEVATFCGA